MTAKEIFFRESLDLTPDTCLAASGGSLTDQLNSHETKKHCLLFCQLFLIGIVIYKPLWILNPILANSIT